MMKSLKPCIAALDVGTSSVKVCLFSLDMDLLARSVQEYRIDARGDRVEAEGEIYLSAVRDGMTDVLKQAKGYRVAAIGVTTQGETFAPVDEAGKPLRPFIVWLDGRAEEQAEKLRAEIPEMEFYRTTGLPEISGALPLAKLLWLKENQPEIYEKTHKFLLVEDFLLHYLTGRFVSEKALQTSTGWFSLETDGLWEKGLEAAGIEPEKLPEILECGEVVGPLTEETARQLGLEPEAILLTHGHFDHVGAVRALVADYDCDVYMNDRENTMPAMMTAGPLYYTHSYDEGDTLTLAGMSFTVLATPGHTPGSVCLLCENAMFSGDTLFWGSCGRTDFPGGSWTDIRKSLVRLAELPGDYRVYPGHGDATRLSFERKMNPYMQ